VFGRSFTRDGAKASVSGIVAGIRTDVRPLPFNADLAFHCHVNSRSNVPNQCALRSEDHSLSNFVINNDSHVPTANA
jgi:hypothetical protein